MKDEDFKGLVAGLEDAIAFVQGDTTKSRVAVSTPRYGEQHHRSPDAPHERYWDNRYGREDGVGVD